MRSFFILLICLFLINFTGVLNISNTILLACSIPFVIKNWKITTFFKKPIALFILFLLLNIVSCYYYRGQGFIDTFKAEANYFYILTYFIWFSVSNDLREVEKGLLGVSTLVIFLYLIQYLLLPYGVVFLPVDELSQELGYAARFKIIGQGFISIGYFFCINKFMLTKKFIYVIIAICAFIAIFAMGFRTMLFFLIVFTLLLIMKFNGVKGKGILYAILFIVILYFLTINIPFLSEKLSEMLERQKTANFSNSDYIRMITLNYYTTEYFNGSLEFILGSGTPFEGSDYYRMHQYLSEGLGMYYADWGLLGFSWIIGIPAVISMLYYSVICIRARVSKPYLYVGFWFLYMIFASFTTSEFCRLGNFVTQSLALYIIYLVKNKEKYENRNTNIS